MVREIGQHGNIVAETEAFLLQVGVDSSPFPDKVLGDLPTIPEGGWTIPPEVSGKYFTIAIFCATDTNVLFF